MANSIETGKLVFAFPGQGSYSQKILRELYDSSAFRPEFTLANDVSRVILGHDFLPLVEVPAGEPCEEILEACPDLDQVAIYLTDCLIARVLLDSGVRPDLLVGHSFGELAALATAGVYSLETGLRIVCQRSAALRQFGAAGKMAAASCNAERARECLRSLGTSSLEVTVINHARQTVISGPQAELENLSEVMARQGIGLTLLKSRYPYHSSLLQPAVLPFQLMLCSYAFQAPGIPVYLCTEQCFYSPESDLPRVLSSHFIKPLDFANLLRTLSDNGYRQFVECGAGTIVTKIVSDAGLPELTARPAARLEDGVKAGCDRILQEFGSQQASTTPPVQELNDLLEQMRAMMARTSRLLERYTAPPKVLSRSDAPQPAPEPSVPPADAEACPVVPIAIVGMGCVLPGARDPEEYWNNIRNGISGIVDLAQEDPAMARDFLVRSRDAEVKIVSDKTYTLLHGSVGTVSDDRKLLARPYPDAAFARLTRAEKLLALAAAQAVAGIQARLSAYEEDRVQCVLGATADGCGEYDDALFPQSIRPLLESIEPDAGVRAGFYTALQRIWGEPPENGGRVSQQSSYEAVIRSVTGRGIRTYVIDAACSSSLYAIDSGMKALVDGQADVVLAGGVFAPGPANNTLFAQFRGLTPVASRPFDASADGVVFGDGAGILVLKRLTDALAAGDPVLAVIRAVGVSSDGKSPAINVPQTKGQVVAIRRAYESSQIDVNTIQYVEAHATATPVGDVVEFNALRGAISRDPALPPIDLGSVKALIGHTGWAAGVASVIKICKAFEKETIPPQHNYASPNPEISLAQSPFQISTAAHPWPVNIASKPRRAAVNGFGFGGTNAHLVLEKFEPAYHRALCGRIQSQPAKPVTLAVIAASSLFPSAAQLEDSTPSEQQEFSRRALHLPKGKRLLPDVQEHMDPGQYLALLAAERVLASLGERRTLLKDTTGVIIGVESKAERGIHANQRIFLDRLKRRFVETDQDPVRQRLLNRLCEAIQQHVIPSGPYTLPGLMPNVISGRVANMFDLNGPNIVVDMGANSLFQSILVARDWLAHNNCSMVLVGGLNALRMGPEDREGAFLMALTTEDTAREQKLPIACLLTLGNSGGREETSKPVACYRGAEGILELSQAIAAARDKKEEYSVPEKRGATSRRAAFRFRSDSPAEAAPKPQPAPAGTYAYVQGTPIFYYTPVEVSAELGTRPVLPLAGRKILFVTDQPGSWKAAERSGALKALDYRVLCPKGAGIVGAVEIDLASDESVQRTLASLPPSFDTIIAAKFLGGVAGNSLLDPQTGANLELLDTLFSISRHAYEGIQGKKIALATVCLGAFVDGRLNPYTGLLSGFVKSLARELPDSVCRIVNVDDESILQGLRCVEAELSQTGECAEVCYRGGHRHVIQFAELEHVAQGSAPLLSRDSVVLATGGGRGVTAVLCEELLTRFGCTVIAVGRTDPTSAPASILSMDAGRLAQYEQQFYREELARDKRKKITQLKDLYRGYQAAHEVHETVQKLAALPGRFEYISADLTDGPTAGGILESIFRKYGRIDLVLHGAGVQISKVLTKKDIRDFRGVVGAKLASLRHIHATCERYAAGRPVHYHILTSAFSYMGNDGQPDYGAANEALGRISDIMNSSASAGRWSSVAWLGWAGIGMTRGSEFAALAASRRLRGITREEGREIFANFLVGTPSAAINVLLAEGEIKFYNVAAIPAGSRPASPVKASPPPRKDSQVTEHTVAVDDVPYVLNHLVDGIPTLPGAFLIMMVANAALELRPNLKITTFEDAAFRRFVRLRSEGPTRLRLHSKVISEDAQGAVVRVDVVSDFVHKSGVVLQKDVVQTEISVRMAAAIGRPGKSGGRNAVQGRLLDDPYVMAGSPVRLNGPFRTMTNIIVGEGGRSADYKPVEKIQPASGYRSFLPNLLVMDSLWRFGAIQMDSRNTMPVYVPEACRVMKVYYDLAAPDIRTLTGDLTLTGSNPQVDEDRLVIGPVEAKDAAGATLLVVEGGVCRKLGEVQSGH